MFRSMKILTHFPDTNFFEQCNPADQLDWTAWNAFDEIHLLVARPVQREIDKHKNQGKERVAKKAAATAKLFRQVLESQEGFIILKSGKPVIKLFIRNELKSDSSVAHLIDENAPDDQLVSIAYSHAQTASDVRVLTHDTGPMATAKMLGLAYETIPDTWRLKPEQGATQKEIAKLNEEIARLKKAEPAFSIQCIDHDDNSIDTLNVEFSIYQPLTESEVLMFLDEIKLAFPETTDFTTKEEPPLPSKLLFDTRFQMQIPLSPPSDAQIDEYHKKYLTWIDTCESRLRTYHKFFQEHVGFPGFTFLATNTGARPAEDALVTLKMNGAVHISRPPHDDSDEPKANPLQFPAPPPVPRPSSRLQAAMGLGDSFAKMMGDYTQPFPITPFPHNLPRERDANAFYYKKSSDPHVISLQCKQWRHGMPAEQFFGLFLVSEDGDEVRGELRCEIHAANLTNPAILKIPVNITVSRKPIYDIVRDRIKAFTNGA